MPRRLKVWKWRYYAGAECRRWLLLDSSEARLLVALEWEKKKSIFA
jgi:hypothetical protein